MLLVGLLVVGRDVELPLKSCSVRAEVQGYVVGLNSTLKYVNNGDNPVEVLFRFPVDESFAVVGMEAVIGGKTITSQIKKKEQAKKDYVDAMARGATAALGEEKSGDIFSISLGNLPVHAEAEIHLKLVGELPIDAEGGVRFTLPAVLKPRYTPIDSVDPLTPIGGRAQQGQAPAVHDFQMAVKSDDVADVTSPTHTLSVNRDDGIINVTLSRADAQPLKKDLVILIHHTEPHSPKVVYELGDASKSQSSYMGAPAVMLSFFPEFEVTRAAGEFIFLVDRSGSMRGSYIRSASETLTLFLKSLPPGCSFNIIGFGSHFSCLFDESVPYNQENMKVAVRHAESLQADLGGTELLAPLTHVFKQRPIPGLPRQIFVLTDGSVSNTQSCIDAAIKNADNSRVFTFGIGSGASTALVKGLAQAGHGTSEFVKEGERMQPKVISSLKQALQPHVANIKVNFELPSNIEIIQAPKQIPSIYSGEKLVVYGILKSKTSSKNYFCSGVTGTATLAGKVLGNSLSFTVPFEIPLVASIGRKRKRSNITTSFEVPFVHQLAAKTILQSWSSGSSSFIKKHKADCIALSLESSVISEHTAFVAVDEDTCVPLEDAITVFDVNATFTEVEFPARPFWSGLNLPVGGVMRRIPSSGKRTSGTRVKQTARKSTGGKAPRASIAKKKCGKKKMSKPVRASAAKKCSKKTFGKALTFPHSCGSKLNIAPSSSLVPASSLPGPSHLVKSSSSSYKSLDDLISLQHATGYWDLQSICAKVLKKRGIDKKCPSGVLPNIWATIIALLMLEGQYVKHKEEWELVAFKAESWLKEQSWPKGVTIQSLRKTAKDLI